MADLSQILIVGSATGAKAQNAEFFSSDLLPQSTDTTHATKFKITIAVAEAAKTLEVSVDSGTTWSKLNNAVALVQLAVQTIEMAIRPGDLFQLRCPEVGGCTLNLCRVDEQPT